MKTKEAELKKLLRRLEREPDSEDLNLKVGLTYFERGEFANAIPCLEKVEKQESESADLHLVLGTAYLNEGNLTEAEKHIRRSTQIDTSHYEAFVKLGYTYHQLGKLAHAEQCLRRATQLSDENAEAENDLAVLLYMQGRNQEAQEMLQAAIRKQPDHVDALLNLGLVHFEQEEYEQAVPFFEKVVQTEPQSSHFRHLGIAHVRCGRAEEGVDALRHAVREDPEDADAWMALSETFQARGELSEAIEAARRVEKIEGATARVASCLAECYLREGRVDEAKEALARRSSAQASAETVSSHAIPQFSSKLRIAPFEMLDKIRPAAVAAEEEVEISIVIPVFNEQDNVEILYEKLIEVLTAMDRKFEIIFVDDGSTDVTLTRLKEINQRDSRVVVISFRKNYGQTAALSAGFDYARGEVIVTMDGDLQNDPRDIPRLLEKMAEGYDLVNGWRKDRQDNKLSRILPSVVANRLIAKITGVKLNDYGCTLKAYKRGIIKNIRLYGEMHRFIPAVVSWLGARTTEIPVQHHPRIHGETKYNIGRTIRVVLDLINVKFLSSYLTRPMQYFGKLGVWLMFLAALGLIVAGVLRWGVGIEFDWLLPTVTAIMLVLVGVQFITIGLIAEIIIRTYHEGQDRPIYVLKEILD